MKKRPTKGSREEMKKKNTSQKLKSPRFKSVEQYLASQDPAKERTLRSVIDLILAEFPELESKISWNVPTVPRNGKYVAGICTGIVLLSASSTFCARDALVFLRLGVSRHGKVFFRRDISFL